MRLIFHRIKSTKLKIKNWKGTARNIQYWIKIYTLAIQKLEALLDLVKETDTDNEPNNVAFPTWLLFLFFLVRKKATKVAGRNILLFII